MVYEFNSDTDINILFSKVDLKRSNFGRTTKTKHAKSGACSRRINFTKHYFYFDVGVKSMACRSLSSAEKVLDIDKGRIH